MQGIVDDLGDKLQGRGVLFKRRVGLVVSARLRCRVSNGPDVARLQHESERVWQGGRKEE